MSTLQSLQTWTTFKKFDNHRVASIGFLKYISTGLTLHYTAKKRVINALVQVNLNESDILAVQECIPVISDSTSNNKRLLDGNRKDYRFSYFRSIHLPCVIWQRKCKSHYRCLWNSLSTRSRYTFKIDPHSKHPILILFLLPTITYILYHMAYYKLLTPYQSRTKSLSRIVFWPKHVSSQSLTLPQKLWTLV